jgi:hypothetical protein
MDCTQLLVIALPSRSRAGNQADGEIKNWLAFSAQKLNEIVILGRGLNQGKASIQTFLQEAAEKLGRQGCNPNGYIIRWDKNE